MAKSSGIEYLENATTLLKVVGSENANKILIDAINSNSESQDKKASAIISTVCMAFGVTEDHLKNSKKHGLRTYVIGICWNLLKTHTLLLTRKRAEILNTDRGNATKYAKMIDTLDCRIGEHEKVLVIYNQLIKTLDNKFKNK